MEDKMRDVKGYFSEVAAQWDELRRGFFTAAMRDAAIARAGLVPGGALADVGTGTGFVLRGLVEHASRLVGFDENPEMLAIAARNLAAWPQVELRLAEGRQLPADDDTFDAVFANMYLHHAPEPARAVAEMARILKPGGKLVITDLDAHNQAWMRAEMADRWLGFERPQIAAWFEEAGLREVAVDCAAGSCDCTRAGQDLSLSVFVAFGTK